MTPVQPRVNILGVPVDVVTRDEAVARLVEWLGSAGQHHVATPNPEMLVEATKNPQLLQVLNRTALNLPDGTGLLWAARRAGTPLRERVTGVDAMTRLCLTNAGKVFLLGAIPGVAEHAAAKLLEANPQLTIVGTFAGSPKPEHEEEILRMINASGATLLFVAYGAPKQELWIDRNLSKMPGVRVAMGVGGAFDFVSGLRKRAPDWMQKAGLEWLWRLLQEPHRLRRILVATMMFPRLVSRASR